MNMKKNNLSLIELLLVTSILGVLVSLVLPEFRNVSTEAKAEAARLEMHKIQRAFQRFYADVLPVMKVNNDVVGKTKSTNKYLHDIALYGLWPLLMKSHPNNLFSYSSYSFESGFGSRAPYLEAEGVVEIADPKITYTFSGGEFGGQATGNSGIKIPVIKDPYGGYYRVLCPETRSVGDGGSNLVQEYKRLQRLVLVCTGPNLKLDTATSSFIDKDDVSYIRDLNGDDIVAQGDDIVIRLLPTRILQER